MQTKTHSLIEAVVNVAVGLTISLLANLYIIPPIIHAPVSIHAAGIISVIFTAISLIRSYTLRRIFNYVSIKTKKSYSQRTTYS